MSPGADDSRDWVADDAGTALPHFVSPDSGPLLIGNEPTTPTPAVFLGRDADCDWRVQRIRALLDPRPAVDIAGFAAMQADTISAFAPVLLPVLAYTEIALGLPQRSLALLVGWNGAMDAARWVKRFVTDVLARCGVPESERDPWKDFSAWLLAAPEADAAFWCDSSCAPLLAASLAEVSTTLSARFGLDPAAWRWGQAHQASFADPLLVALPVLGWLITHRVAVPDDDTALSRGSQRPTWRLHLPARRSISGGL